MRPARGFTLMEVLLATALLAAGMALAFTTLRTATGSVARAEHLAAATEQTRSAQRFVRRQVSLALPLVYERNERTGLARQLWGEPGRLVFVGNMPGHLSHGGPHLQMLELVPDDDRGREGYRLEFSYRLLIGEMVVEPEDARPPVILVDGIADGVFEFRGLLADGEMSDWEPGWEMPMQLPRLVRLNLRFVDERRFWPPLAMALNLTESARFQDELIPGPTRSIPEPGRPRGRGR